MQGNCNDDNTRKHRNRLPEGKLRSTHELSRKVLREVQPQDETHGQWRESQPHLPSDSINSRKSLAWDSAFFTSPGAFDLEELLQKLNLHDVENVKDSSRPSLAWDSGFFTSEGVLDAEELSMIHNELSKTSMVVPSGIDNDLWASSKMKTSVGKENLALWNLENDLFKDGNAYVFRSMDSAGSTPKIEGWSTEKPREASSNSKFPDESMMQPMLSSTKKPVAADKSEQSLKKTSYPPRCQVRHAAKEGGGKLPLVSKRPRRNSLLNFLSRRHNSTAKVRSDDCAGIHIKSGTVDTSMSDIMRGTASSVNPNLNASALRPKSPLRCSRDKTGRMENPPCASNYYVLTSPVSSTEKRCWKSSFSVLASHKDDSSESSNRDSGSEMPINTIQEVACAGGTSPAASTDVKCKKKPSLLRLPSPKLRLSNEDVPKVPKENGTPISQFGKENSASKVRNRSCNLNNSAERARTPTKTVTRSGDTKLRSVKPGASRSPLVTRSPHPRKVQKSSPGILTEYTKQQRTTGSREPLQSTFQNVKDGQVGLRASKRSRNEHEVAGTQHAGNLFGITLDDDKENLACVDSDYNLGSKPI